MRSIVLANLLFPENLFVPIGIHSLSPVPPSVLGDNLFKTLKPGVLPTSIVMQGKIRTGIGLAG